MQLQTSTESINDYVLQKAIPDGSNLYYACVFEEASYKQQIISFHAFLNELIEILIECSDPGIARIKLQWWLEELERLENHQPRHPVTRCLQKSTSIDKEIIDQLNKVVLSTEGMLLIQQPDSLESALAVFDKQSGIIWQLCAKQFCNNTESVIKKINDLSNTYHYLQAILRPSTYVTESCCLIPSNYIDKQIIFSSKQISTQHQEQLRKLLNDLQSKIEENLSELTKSERHILKHMIILNRIAKKTVIKMQSHVFPWSTDQVSSTPISKLLFAWWFNTKLRF